MDVTDDVTVDDTDPSPNAAPTPFVHALAPSARVASPHRSIAPPSPVPHVPIASAKHAHAPAARHRLARVVPRLRASSLASSLALPRDVRVAPYVPRVVVASSSLARARPVARVIPRASRASRASRERVVPKSSRTRARSASSGGATAVGVGVSRARLDARAAP